MQIASTLGTPRGNPQPTTHNPQLATAARPFDAGISPHIKLQQATQRLDQLIAGNSTVAAAKLEFEQALQKYESVIAKYPNINDAYQAKAEAEAEAEALALAPARALAPVRTTPPAISRSHHDMVVSIDFNGTQPGQFQAKAKAFINKIIDKLKDRANNQPYQGLEIQTSNHTGNVITEFEKSFRSLLKDRTIKTARLVVSTAIPNQNPMNGPPAIPGTLTYEFSPDDPNQIIKTSSDRCNMMTITHPDLNT